MIQLQLEMLQSNPSPAEVAEKTIDYVEAKEAYFNTLRVKVPGLMNIAWQRKKSQPTSVSPLNWELDFWKTNSQNWLTGRIGTAKGPP